MTLESDKPIRIGNFHPPQIKVAKTGKYRELTDETYNAQSVQTVVADFFSGTGNMTKVFDEDMNGISIVNGSETDDLTFTINNVTRPVFAKKGSYNSLFKQPYREISIAAKGPWYIDLLQTIGAAASIVEPEPPDTTAPDNVTNLKESNVTQNSATLTWDASASQDTVGYEIWRAGTLLTTVTGTTYNATGMTASTQYTYTVKAKDGAGNVASGTSVNVTTAAQPSDTTPPNNVTGLIPSNVTQTGVTLTWQASDSSDVKDYRIYNGSTLITTVTGLSYGVTGLTASTDYSFTVKARDNANNEAPGTSVNVKTAAPADTTAPILTITPAATFVDTKEVTMSTNEPADIYYTQDGSTPTTAKTKYTTPLTLTDTTTVKAMARDLAGNESAVQTVIYTKDAQEPPDTTSPDPVSGLTAGTPTATTIPITFDPSLSGDVANYIALRSTDGVNFTEASASISASSTSYTFTGLTANTPYWLRIVAIDGAGNRSTAVTVQATTAEPSLIIAEDTFNKPDRSGLGTALTGQVWNPSDGLDISGGAARHVTGSATASTDWVETGVSDNFEISCEFEVTTPTNVWGIIVRDNGLGGLDSGWCFGGINSLTKAGFYGNNPSYVTVDSLSGVHTYKVRVQGQTIQGFIDDVLVSTITDTTRNSNTKHGLWIYNIMSTKARKWVMKRI